MLAPNGSRHPRTVVLGDPLRPIGATLHEPVVPTSPAVVVAIHGAGMTAGYFDARTDPSLSLCSVATRLGYRVLAVDRPGYGHSAARYPDGLPLDQQADALCAALDDIAERTGAPLFLLAHSYGGALALVTAARAPWLDLVGIDVSGIGYRPARFAAGSRSRRARPSPWGKLRNYPPRTFELAAPITARVPAHERDDIEHWPARMPAIAAGVTAPVRFTFAEHEGWWAHDGPATSAITALFAPGRATVEHMPGAGHNISLGWAAAAYHLKVLAYLEQMMIDRFAHGKHDDGKQRADIPVQKIDTA